MRKIKASKRRKNRSDSLGIILIIIALCTIILLGTAYFFILKNKQVYDVLTLCPVTGPERSHVVLIDRSDGFSTLQSLEIRQDLTKIKNSIQLNERLVVYTVEPSLDKSNLKVLVNLCNPGDGSKSNPFISNPKKIHDKWESSFSKVIDDVIESVIVSGENDTSPIMETLREVSIKEFSMDPKSTKYNELTIFSDMLQNNGEINHYNPKNDFQESFSDQSFVKYLSNLERVNVSIRYLVRDITSKLQTPNHVTFWQEYINKSGGTLVSVKKIAN